MNLPGAVRPPVRIKPLPFDDALTQMRGGIPLICTNIRGHPVWHVGDRPVTAAVARTLIRHPDIMPGGDALFGDLDQTFRHKTSRASGAGAGPNPR
jgi:hypothetical protein